MPRLSFTEAMDNIEFLPESELQKIIQSPGVSVAQKETLLEASPIEDKTALTESLNQAIKQSEYTEVIKQLNNETVIASLAPQEKADLLTAVATSTVAKVKEFEEEGVAAVLITPDNKVVYFEDHPDLKAALPVDGNGEIIGIKVDENLNPISTISTEGATEETLAEVQGAVIPVVNQYGEIVMMPVLNEIDQTLVVAPTTDIGTVAGVSNEQLEGSVVEATPGLIDQVVEVVGKSPTRVEGIVNKNGAILFGTGQHGLQQIDATQVEVIQRNETKGRLK
jgi:hypothetical protein